MVVTVLVVAEATKVDHRGTRTEMTVGSGRRTVIVVVAIVDVAGAERIPHSAISGIGIRCTIEHFGTWRRQPLMYNEQFSMSLSQGEKVRRITQVW